ncbi:MAG: efflux RND transporter periplasmic adaptor subunit [Gammaproteobacteria bacterium]|nr:efflux RND transporter periplasmic adaptor subunit [Gammaproteobacteria bacterium]
MHVATNLRTPPSHRYLRSPMTRLGLVLVLLAGVGGCDQAATDRDYRSRTIPVITETASRSEISDRIEAVGTTNARESIDITARVSNVVTRIGFEESSRVDAGQVLVELESSEARANLAAAQADLVDLQTQLKRSEELIQSRAVSVSQVDQQRAQVEAARARVEASQAALRDHTLRAPFAGKVGLRQVSVGSLVSPGDIITTLDDISAMQLDFAVPESYLAALENGLPISARTTAYPDEVFTGTVVAVGSRVDPVTRTVTVRAKVPNVDARLRPGMFMTVVLEKNPRESIVVPEQAIVPEDRSKYVYIVDGDTVMRREVTLGTRQPGSVEIVAGLEAGEEFVTEGTQSLRDGSVIERRQTRGEQE